MNDTQANTIICFDSDGDQVPMIANKSDWHEPPPDNHCRMCRYWDELKSLNENSWGDCCNLECQMSALGKLPPYLHSYGCIFHRPKEATE
jgi:hypothetical protein